MRTGLAASLALHVGALALAFVSLPDFLRTHVEPSPNIPVQLIDEAELGLKTSAPAVAPAPRPKPPEEKPAPPPAEEPEPPTTPEPDPPKEPAPEPEKPPEKKPEQRKPPEKIPEKPPEDELDLDALAALVDKSRRNNQQAPDETGETDRQDDDSRAAIGEGDTLTATEIDKMRAAVSRCWNAGAIIGAPNPERLVVVVDIDLNEDGTLKGAPRVVNAAQINLSGNRFWKVAEQTALRAVVGCQPYDFLDPARYREWAEFQLNFDPATMAGY